MPILRVTRDKRGYESTYLVHTECAHGKTRPKILYWYRSPPDVRVGRAPLDAEAIRLIEERYPDLSFDWGKMLKSRPVAKASTSTRERDAGRRRTPPGRADARPAAAAATARAVGEDATRQDRIPAEPEPPTSETVGPVDQPVVAGVQQATPGERQPRARRRSRGGRSRRARRAATTGAPAVAGTMGDTPEAVGVEAAGEGAPGAEPQVDSPREVEPADA